MMRINPIPFVLYTVYINAMHAFIRFIFPFWLSTANVAKVHRTTGWRGCCALIMSVSKLKKYQAISPMNSWQFVVRRFSNILILQGRVLSETRKAKIQRWILLNNNQNKQTRTQGSRTENIDNTSNNEQPQTTEHWKHKGLYTQEVSDKEDTQSRRTEESQMNYKRTTKQRQET